MKRIAVPIALLLALAAYSEPKRIGLAWTPSPNADEADVCLVLHSDYLPATNWAVFLSLDKLASNCWFMIEPGPHFFTVQYSNFWGVSPLSNIASTPPIPTPGEDLAIFRGEP